MNECASWSTWKNWDSPAGTGDKEIGTRLIPEGYGKVNTELQYNCNKIGLEGRIVENHEMITTQKVQITPEGLTCLNANQIDDDCVDYETRSCCKGTLNSVSKRFYKRSKNTSCIQYAS